MGSSTLKLTEVIPTLSVNRAVTALNVWHTSSDCGDALPLTNTGLAVSPPGVGVGVGVGAGDVVGTGVGVGVGVGVGDVVGTGVGEVVGTGVGVGEVVGTGVGEVVGTGVGVGEVVGVGVGVGEGVTTLSVVTSPPIKNDCPLQSPV